MDISALKKSSILMGMSIYSCAEFFIYLFEDFLPIKCPFIPWGGFFSKMFEDFLQNK
jgi:hypothetical protein